MGYHKRTIIKGDIGDISKVQEEVEEFLDAKEQKCIIMEQLELADIYGALEFLASTYQLTMDDLKKMSDLTKSAFKEGSRKYD